MSQLISLDAIGLKHGTDKASSHHNYLSFYESFFWPLQKSELTVLEIGILNGASLATWEEYFVKSKIVGADIDPSTRRFERGRVSVEVVDQSNIEELTRLAVKHGPFDVIIEDGSHMWEHQITSLRTLFPFVKGGGCYIVEDLQTNYGSLQQAYRGVASSTCVDLLKRWVDLRVADAQIPVEDIEDAFLRTYGRAVDFITFYRRACLIKKRFPLTIREIYANQPLIHECSADSLIPIRVLAHIGYFGDVGNGRGFINTNSDVYTIQGISIEPDKDVLEYRVRLESGLWGEWSGRGSFVGTRGQSQSLTGVAVRLRTAARGRYSVRLFGRFVGYQSLVESADGQDCIPSNNGALTGLQILIQERSD
jgi:hypothetical protein